MTSYSNITQLISQFRIIRQRDSITPETLGFILQSLADFVNDCGSLISDPDKSLSDLLARVDDLSKECESLRETLSNSSPGTVSLTNLSPVFHGFVAGVDTLDARLDSELISVYFDSETDRFVACSASGTGGYYSDFKGSDRFMSERGFLYPGTIYICEGKTDDGSSSWNAYHAMGDRLVKLSTDDLLNTVAKLVIDVETLQKNIKDIQLPNPSSLVSFSGERYSAKEYPTFTRVVVLSEDQLQTSAASPLDAVDGTVALAVVSADRSVTNIDRFSFVLAVNGKYFEMWPAAQKFTVYDQDAGCRTPIFKQWYRGPVDLDPDAVVDSDSRFWLFDGGTFLSPESPRASAIALGGIRIGDPRLKSHLPVNVYEDGVAYADASGIEIPDDAVTSAQLAEALGAKVNVEAWNADRKEISDKVNKNTLNISTVNTLLKNSYVKKAELPDFDNFLTPDSSVQWGKIIGAPTIPGKTSELTQDSDPMPEFHNVVDAGPASSLKAGSPLLKYDRIVLAIVDVNGVDRYTFLAQKGSAFYLSWGASGKYSAPSDYLTSELYEDGIPVRIPNKRIFVGTPDLDPKSVIVPESRYKWRFNGSDFEAAGMVSDFPTRTTPGLIKVGFRPAADSDDYAVETDENGNAYVHVPSETTASGSSSSAVPSALVVSHESLAYQTSDDMFSKEIYFETSDPVAVIDRALFLRILVGEAEYYLPILMKARGDNTANGGIDAIIDAPKFFCDLFGLSSLLIFLSANPDSSCITGSFS